MKANTYIRTTALIHICSDTIGAGSIIIDDATPTSGGNVVFTELISVPESLFLLPPLTFIVFSICKMAFPASFV